MKERRQFHRVAQTLEGRYRVSGEFTSAVKPMTLLNLGAGGVRFRGSELLEKHQMIEIEAAVPGLRGTLVVKGRVAWSAMRASGVAETGAEFMEISPDQRFQIDKIVQFFRGASQAPPAA